MSDYLPRDVITDILLQLPAKSLVRHSCVCKLWRDIITGPEFIAKYGSKGRHYHDDDHQRKPLFLAQYNGCYSEPPEGVEYIDWPYHDIHSLDGGYRVYGFCKGLILLSNLFKNPQFFIVNPSLGRRFITLPLIGCHHVNYCGGIGYDSVTNDYKVLILSFPNPLKPAVMNLYSLNNNSWKDINSQYSHAVLHPMRAATLFMNGYIHWIACTSPSDLFPDIISRFDVTHEVFDIMSFPDIGDERMIAYSFAIVFEKFSLGNIMKTCAFSLWVMSEYGVKESWTKQFRVDFGDVGGCITHVLGSHANEILFSFLGRVGSYDPIRKKIRCLGVPCDITTTLHMDKFEESLVLFDHIAPTSEKPTFKPLFPCGSKKRKNPLLTACLEKEANPSPPPYPKKKECLFSESPSSKNKDTP